MHKTLLGSLIALSSMFIAPAQSETTGMRPGDHLLSQQSFEYMVPIAFYGQDGRFREVPITDYETAHQSEIQTILNKFYPSKSMAPLFLNGQNVGQFLNGAYQSPGCTGFGSMKGTLKSPGAGIEKGTSLSFSSGFPGTRQYNQGSLPITDALKQQMTTLTQEQFLKKGIAKVDLKRMKVDEIKHFYLHGQKVAFMSSYIAHTDKSMQCFTDSLAIMAEQTGQSYVLRMTDFKSATKNNDGDCEQLGFLSTFALGSQPDHVVLEGTGYEWGWYEIYKWTPQGLYERVYLGQDTGC